MEAESSSSFSSFGSYLRALSHTPCRLRDRACSVSTSSQEMSRVRSPRGSAMKRALRWYDLLGFGLGGMVGAGMFVTTGRASRLCAGPSVVVSYAVAGFCATLSALCYTEFAVEMPVAGGAFTYIRVTFGELAAFIAGANLIMDYVMSNAAIARSFTSYLGTAIGVSSSKWRINVKGLPDGFNEVDILALIIIVSITLIICYSTRESSVTNMILTTLHIFFIAFIVLLGFLKGDWENFTRPNNPKHPSGFFPFGVSGVFKGASMVYFSYIGYDAVSTMAEEVQDPVKDIPIGVSGSVAIVTLLYCLMAASMSKLLPYDMIDVDAPFSGAFRGQSKGLQWVSRVIGIGACFGILTSLLVAMLGQARYMCVIGRSNIAPTWFSKIHAQTSTPVNASAFLGIVTAIISVFADLNLLVNLVSIGTLFVFYMVANAVIYKRYVVMGTTNPWPTLSFLCLFSFTCISFTLLWHFLSRGKTKNVILGICAVLALALTRVFHVMVPQARTPEFWATPLMPWIPCTSIFLNIFLLGALDGQSYIRFCIFSTILLLVYLFYSIHSSFDAMEKESSSQNNGEA